MNAIIPLDSEPKAFPAQIMGGREPGGVWAVYDYEVGVYARAVYGAEIDALRRINADGYGRVCFWPFGADLRESIDSRVSS